VIRAVTQAHNVGARDPNIRRRFAIFFFNSNNQMSAKKVCHRRYVVSGAAAPPRNPLADLRDYFLV